MTVTEAEWLACMDPMPMLEYLGGKASERKLRLFAVACCRRIWHLLIDERSRKAVEVAERFAEGGATERELTQAEDDAANLWNNFAQAEGYVTEAETEAAYATWGAACHEEAAIGAAKSTSDSAAQALSYEGQEATEQESQCRLLREIFGNPFRPVALAPTVLAWNDSTVARLAEAAYDQRHLPAGTLDNGRLVVLADALEEACCTDADILDHLRGPGPHVRGCWPVDLCLGKT
jgi:hypothetical protein